MGVIVKNPDILGGTPVFRGTRVPIQTLFDYLEGGETLEDFLEDFPLSHAKPPSVPSKKRNNSCSRVLNAHFDRRMY
jgi:hypothetical protein